MKPFLDFYSKNNISPVHQDISNLDIHFQRRNALYRHLGIAPNLVADRSVIEFGPGVGHNAIHTLALRPRRYVLVDGNPSSLAEVGENMARCTQGAQVHEIVASDILSFQSAEKFDLVLCEGVIPFQLDPAAFCRHVGSFCEPGGVFVLTCIDGISFLGEATRRLIADVLVPFSIPVSERLECLRPLFAPHLQSLAGMSRKVDDWLYDNILVPYSGRLFSIRDAIEALDGTFDLYGSSPHFLADWRWYKQIHGEGRRYNELGIDTYLKNALNLIDYRFDLPPQTTEVGLAALERAEALFMIMRDLENNGDQSRLPEVVDLLRGLAAMVRPLSEPTARALEQTADFILAPEGKDPVTSLNDLAPFFGRGQQYLSFIRRT